MKLLRTLPLVILVAACGGSTPNSPSPHLELFEATASQIAVIDAQTHFAVRHLPLGIPSPDWKHLYSTTGAALIDVDPRTGVTEVTVQLPGRFELPQATSSGMPGGTSPNGDWLVAESYDGTATHLVIVETAAMRVVHTENLTGHFHFDAISNDGQRLYLIQYLNGREYYVRLFNVVSGTLDENIVVDKSNGEQSMSGVRLSGIATPGGGWLFSMYVREQDNPFIHALSLDGPFAFCLDLPGSGYGSNASEMHWSIAMNETGDSIYAVNAATGVLAWIDNSQQFNPNIKRTVRVSGGNAATVGPNAAVVTRDGAWLVMAGDTGLVWIDTRTLGVRMHALRDWTVWSLALGPDGKTVYAVDDRGRIAEVGASSGAVSYVFDPGVGRPISLMRIAAI